MTPKLAQIVGGCLEDIDWMFSNGTTGLQYLKNRIQPDLELDASQVIDGSSKQDVYKGTAITVDHQVE
ncbi:hypothetical protein LTR29_017112 [Friedmanniomyces endolithicus]|nr:hypothetical protein LTS09_017391 [Friedmanniomyces endolithicus]KAK0302225.1 hypothetical protein LTR01_008892 [Friedmanniomyces endolithicus]KAK0823248.1 hypothetical protein LTR73_008671 [Friedmanniomyces endolithicus]KAK0929277.1 hypothetical protein LTR29_017112 [Friedmanniomyces endolithicus]